MINLEGKKVLFFYPDFFGYGELVAQKMKDLGATVYLYNSKAHNSSFLRALFKINPDLVLYFSKSYFSSILQRHIKDNFDYLLVVERLPNYFLERFIVDHPSAKRILYMDDSIKNLKTIESKFVYFHKILSFDPKDAKENSFIDFRPLYYSDDCINRKKDTIDKYEYDLCFIGTCHSDRYYIVKQIREKCKFNHLSFFSYLYLQSWFMYIFYKITNRLYWNSNFNEFDYKKMSYKETISIENSSKVVLDIQHQKQTGLTMRTIELLGLEKKMITTNHDIVNYDFYRPHNILVIDRKTPQIDIDFFKTEYEPLPADIVNKYSITEWVKEVLEN